MPPKVFISHASEDKERFVIRFATALRENGIDAWFDRWEMKPGDSLVDKIFEEGIKEASAVIVVLSQCSVNKPWVRVEINSAFVQHVNNGIRLIPVIIDDCDVPAALQGILWHKVNSLTVFNESLQTIIAAILGTSDKPPVGSLPAYITSLRDTIGDLSAMDSAVLKIACEEALKIGHHNIDSAKIYINDGQEIFPVPELKESLRVLEHNCFLKLTQFIGGPAIPYVLITSKGFEAYAKSCIDNYEEVVSKTVSALVNKSIDTNQALSREVECEQLLIDHILVLLRNDGLIKLTEYAGGLKRAYNVSPVLKRRLGC